MKRIVCYLLFIILVSTTFFSNAENYHAPFIQHIWDDDILNDWVLILGLKGKLESEPIEENDEIMKSLHSNNPPDLFSIEGYELSDYLNEDFCAPFSPSDKMLEEMKNMPPIIQQALKENIYTKDGRLYAYPRSMEVTPMLYWVPEVWKDSPFGSVEPPTSFSELLDFLEIYLDTPHEGYCFYYDVNESTNPRRNWIELLIKCWVIQCNYSHQEVSLNNCEFIPLLKRTVELINKLHKIEPNKKKQKGRQLITTYNCGYSTNGQDQFSWKNMIPWRISSNQPPLVNVSMSLYCARKGSPFSDRASDLFDSIIDHRQDVQNGKVLYKRYLFLNKDWIDINEYNKQVLKKHGSKWKCLYMTQEYVDSIWEIEKWGVPCMVNEYFLLNVPWEIQKKGYNLMAACAENKITADDFTAQMDQLVFNSN